MESHFFADLYNLRNLDTENILPQFLQILPGDISKNKQQSVVLPQTAA